MAKKFLTLKEARALLPLVEDGMERMSKLRDALALLDSVNQVYEDNYYTLQEYVIRSRRKHKLLYKFYKELAELMTHGAIVKDLESGLVDFCSHHRGKEIMLCWKLGEEDIMYWHHIDEGFGGRQSIEALESDKLDKHC
ncbi:MAG: DUF2203 domain-containing protein [Nanoarchaeota archaeon]